MRRRDHNPPMRGVFLYGPLADKYGHEHRLAAWSPKDAVQVMTCNYPEFELDVRRGWWHVAVGDEPAPSREIMPAEVTIPREAGDFHFVPAMVGGKSRTGKAIFQIAIGGALLATGIGGALATSAAGTTTGAQASAAAALGVSPAAAGIQAGFGATAFTALGTTVTFGTLTVLGAAFALGGLSNLVAKQPSSGADEDSPSSFTFGAPIAVNREGATIPVLLGEVVTGGVVVSSALESSSTGAVSPPTTGFNRFGGGAFFHGRFIF